MLACWRMGRCCCPATPSSGVTTWPSGQGSRTPALCVGEEDLLAELPDGIPYMTMDEIAAVLDEDRPQETPAEIARLRPGRPGPGRVYLGDQREPRAALHAQRYLSGQRAQAEHWLGARDGELAWCTTATGRSKSARNVFLAPWRRGAAAMLVDGRFEPAERPELIERERVDVLARRRPSTGCWQSGRSSASCRRCGGWSPPARRSTPR